MTVQYVFWDSDNTLVNTAEHHWRKHFETLKSLGITLDDKYRTDIYTNNGSQNYAWISRELGLNIAEQDYLDLIDKWFFDHISAIEIRKDIVDCLSYLKNQNIPQAVVSNGRKRSVMSSLEGKDLTQYFDFILCKEDYTGRKPEPTPYLKALQKMNSLKGLNIRPENCLVVEDDPKGVESGKAAGMRVIHRPMGDDFPLLPKLAV